MNIPLDRKLALQATPQTGAPVEEATAVALGATLTAVFVDRPAGPRQRLRAEQDSLPIPRPFIAAELALRSGGARHVLLMPQPADTVLSRHLLLYLDNVPAAEIDPRWLQLPQEELAALAAQLTPQAVHKLLRIMVTTGASLFAPEVQRDLADSIPRLMDLCGSSAIVPVARTDIAGRTLLSYSVKAPGLGEARDAVALPGEHMIRLKDLDCLAEGKLLHVLLPSGLVPAQIVLFSESPLRLAAPDASLRRLSIQTWLQGRSTSCRDWLLSLVGSEAEMLAAELSPGQTEPTIAVRHLSSVPEGLLYALQLTDPSRLVRTVVLEHRGHCVELTPSYGVDGAAILAGFSDLPVAARGDESCRIHAIFSSGRQRLLAVAQAPAYDGAIPAVFEDAWAMGVDTLQPLSQARSRLQRPTPPITTQHFGPTKACKLRIVTSIGNSADLIRARAAMILAEDGNPAVEVICTMTDGPLALAARQALAQTAAIYGIPHRLVLLPDYANASEHLRAALAYAQDAPVLVLGADVLPEGRGWLAFWSRRLRRQIALAPALLAADSSIAATREGQDPSRGLPPAHLPASGRVVDRPLAHSLALGVGGIAQILASGAPHPDPAVWIASVLGGTRTETRHLFRRFGPAITPSAYAAALAETEFAMLEKAR